jgi:hypothetical protein
MAFYVYSANFSLVCAIEHIINKESGTDLIAHATAIAGDLKEHGGGYIDPNWLRLKTSDSHSDSEKEGLLLTINGGFRKDPDNNTQRPQKAVIEFICDKALEGNENLFDPEDKYEDGKPKRAESGNSSLTFVKYDTTGEKEDVLRLEWRTKYACEDSKREQDVQRGDHWGFFTWFIIM